MGSEFYRGKFVNVFLIRCLKKINELTENEIIKIFKIKMMYFQRKIKHNNKYLNEIREL